MNTNWERIFFDNSKQNKSREVKEHTNISKIVCVLCGGLQEDGTPHEFVKKRLDKAYEIYENNKDVIILILGGGTYHKSPYLNKDNFAVHESSSCAYYLYNKGVNKKHMFREWSSYDTIANGFFAFTNYLNYLNISKMIVITSDFHIERSRTIFDYFNKLFDTKINIQYIETKSFLSPEIYSVRFNREKKSKEHFQENIVNKIINISDFINWFYTEHKAYMSIIEYEKDKTEKSNIDKTY